MRIITGKNRGLRLKSPKGLSTRPTSDRVKESVFNILGNVSGATVLDLFAGTGSIGLEFLSRGAKDCTFVERDFQTSLVLKENIDKTKNPNYGMIVGDYKQALNKLQAMDSIYDYIYIDPPYDRYNYYSTSLKLISDYNLIDDGTIVLESSNDLDIDIVDGFKIINQRKYGDTIVTFVRRHED